MAAVLGIVRGHHGAIKVFSEPGKGTTFKVLFPASPGDVYADDTEELSNNVRQLRGKTVLLVDDEETVRLVTKRLLERLGLTVVTAENGIEALARFREATVPFDIVLLDLTMPHMDGEEAFRELRRIREDVCVLLSSGYNEQDLINRFANKKLAGFIQKPYQLSTLSTALLKALGIGDT